jgi:hypothetical protein
VAVTLALESRPLRRAVAGGRGPLYAVAALVVLLMFGIGAAQADDVIRAWDPWRAVWAVLATAALAITVLGVTRFMTSSGRENWAPGIGRSVQPFLLLVGVLVGLAGLTMWLLGWGWGLVVGGGLLLLLWALGVPIDGLRCSLWPIPLPGWVTRRWPALAPEDRPVSGPGADAVAAAQRDAAEAVALRYKAITAAARGGVARVPSIAERAEEKARSAEAHADEAWGAVDAATGAEPGSADPAIRAVSEAVTEAWQAARGAREAQDAEEISLWGDRLGRLAGGAVAAIIVVVVARAIALDAFVREDRSLAALAVPLTAALAVAALGAVLCWLPSRGLPLLLTPWVWCTFAALGMGAVALVDRAAIIWPDAAGTVAVLLGGFTVLVGGVALTTWAIRRPAVTQYTLAPALRALRLTRFPVLPLLIVWVLVVSMLDSGGYHDIRRTPRPQAAPAPSIGQAWQEYLAATGTSGPDQVRPVVIVAAHGGGIRAAVWTGLVLECLFGPGPVRNSGNVCAKGEGMPDRDTLAAAVAEPLPVFLASGASGGSVGIAAWSARRADLLVDASDSETPLTVEEALSRDFVAPDVARLLVGDVPRAFLAWNLADRAEMLERAWERPWRQGDDGPRGLTRGLRETWDVSHGGGEWATPVLALNGDSVEDGCRFLASAVDFTLPRQVPDTLAAETAVSSADDQPNDAACRGIPQPTGTAADILPSTNELIDYLCPDEDVPLSTAAHLSARFPLVSPTGRVARGDCADRRGLVNPSAVSYAADGGFFDNAGAGTAVDTWRALAPVAAEVERDTGGCVVPIFVQIDNSAPAATISTGPDPRPNELLAPVEATLGQVGSRESYARAGAARSFGQLVSAGGRRVDVTWTKASDSLWFRVALGGQPGPEPPLGWTLAPKTVQDMRAQLRSESNRYQIESVRRMLEPGGLTCQ